VETDNIKPEDDGMNPDEMPEPQGSCNDDKCRECPERDGCKLRDLLQSGGTLNVGSEMLEGERAIIGLTFLEAAKVLPLNILRSWEDQVGAMLMANRLMQPLINILRGSKPEPEPEHRPEPEANIEPEHRPEPEPEHRPEDQGSIFNRMQENLKEDFGRN
jgi:hypothetical protein